MFRRSSYASVVSGQASSTNPQRSGAFSHLVNANATSGQAAPHHGSSGHARNHSRSLEADGHHNGMSMPWGRSAGPLPTYASQFGSMGNGFGVVGHEEQASSFFVPSYLRGSRHAERLEEAHKAKLAAQREHRSNHSSATASLSTSSSSVNLHKMVPSHRGMTHDIIERAPPLVEEHVASWPMRWSEADKFAQIEVQGDGLEVRFQGPAKTHEESASIRTDYPMPRQCGIYYFEVTVVSKGKEGRMIGIGFGSSKVVLNRIPGWEPESWAYHGDDGMIFSNTTSGKQFGPKFTTSDVIGCGINFRTGCAFFTKNGSEIGVAFRDIKHEKLYPMVGMRKPGETLRANFGQTPFVFDIDSMVKKEKEKIQSEINMINVPGSHSSKSNRPQMDETALIHELIVQYLAHDGYVETARAFAEEVREESRSLSNNADPGLKHLDPAEDMDAINRQRIRAAILDGDIDKALKHTAAYRPTVLRDNENIYFKLRCRKFIEMVRKCTELTVPSKRSATNGHHHGSDDYDVFDHQMELDDQFATTDGQWGAESMDTEEPVDSSARYQEMLQETLIYGQELKAEFSNDPRREVKKALTDTFALMAYPDARESSLASLLDVSGRVPVAEELNSAILVSLGKSSSAALERLCQQTEVLVADLAEDGGAGAFINVRSDFLR
ncbi:Ran-binding protein-like protein [Lophium mytilinum]|uniref:Ran-binding protein-like protein n=1 Tax=Lophium mytilinum TaxID=390894 RepID=A0A6A6QT42_9PEZI|nr:Ran-binding protein-like protein [Lophium mytilinum]